MQQNWCNNMAMNARNMALKCDEEGHYIMKLEVVWQFEAHVTKLALKMAKKDMKTFATKEMKLIQRRDNEAMNTCKVELFGERALISSCAMLIGGAGGHTSFTFHTYVVVMGDGDGALMAHCGL